ncbi:hypothetical protein O181_116025 [Austropuccinia psidii MF-1]|uniref:Uncharacterized protein n=1 Tax=Austropuccinia psidii MF-1 TaxID=1389203 RepID=A0A9Q3KBK5_9BASI|nr:hypothetical protein [Austropuccinia psidii MF-1]
MLEKGCTQRLPYENIKNDLVDIHPTARSFKIMLDKERHNANKSMQDSFRYSKEKLEKSHKPPDFIVGDLVLVSTLSFNKIKGPKKLKDSFSGPLIIRELHVPNSVKLKLTGELMKKQSAFPVSLIKSYSSSDKEFFPLRKKPTL